MDNQVVRVINKKSYKLRIFVDGDEDCKDYPYFDMKFDNGGYYCCVGSELDSLIKDLQEIRKKQIYWEKKLKIKA